MQFYTCVNRFGNELLYCGYDNGRRVATKVPFQPTLFVPSNRQTDIVSLDGKFLEPRPFETMREARDYINMYTDGNLEKPM